MTCRKDASFLGNLPASVKAANPLLFGAVKAESKKTLVVKGPNKTEREYFNRFIAPLVDSGIIKHAQYEGMTFRLASNHRYTPDWVVVYPNGRLCLIEVKGLYRFGSHQRARLAFDQARLEWPMFDWIWVVKTKDGWEAK